MKLCTLLFAVSMTFGSLTVRSQQDSAKQHQKIEQLLGMMNMEGLCLQAANSSADQTIANTPQLSGKKEETRAFFVKYMNYQACKDDLVKIYAKYYTTEELEELIRFYKSPAGKKFNSSNAAIQTESMTRTSQTLQAHADELNRLVNVQGSTPAKIPGNP